MINRESLSEWVVIVITLLHTKTYQNQHSDAMGDFLSCLVKCCNFFPPHYITLKSSARKKIKFT